MYVPHKDPEKARAYRTKYFREVWYPKNRKKHISYVRNLKRKLLSYIHEYKKESFCVDCGFSGRKYPHVLEFDHTNGEKKFEIAAHNRFTLSLERLKEEMAKCELVCANCHRIRTFARKQYSGVE